MNGKFFDLKKEKQDRMINAALKSFALQGYLHASTDVIVKEAGISKGLLFHYFENKLGLYTFVYDYSVRYMRLELKTVSPQEHDLFELFRQVQEAHTRAMREYPYIQQFLNRSMTEDVGEALIAVESMRNRLTDTYNCIYQKADYQHFPAGVDGKKVRTMMEWTIKGILTERILDASFQPNMLYREICGYIDMMQRLTSQK